MALDAGSVFVKLGGLFQKGAFDEFDRGVDHARAKAKDDINADLGAVVDERGFRHFTNLVQRAEAKRATATLDADTRPAQRRVAELNALIKATSEEIKKRREFGLDTTSAQLKLAALHKEYERVGRKGATRDAIRGLKELGEEGERVAKQLQREQGLGGAIRRLWSNIGLLGKTAIVASPLITALAGSLTALIGSLGGAALGAGAVGLGGLSALIVGFGSLAAVAKPLLTDVKQVKTAFDAYNKAVDQYGKNSTQAATAQKALNAAMKAHGGKEILGLIKDSAQFGKEWEKATGTGRKALAGMFRDAIQMAHKNLDNLSGIANNSAVAFSNAMSSVFKRLGHGEFQSILTNIGHMFARDVGVWGHAATNTFIALGHVAERTAPFVHRMAVSFRESSRDFLDWSRKTDSVDSFLKTTVGHMRSWVDLLKATGRLLVTVFKGGARDGQSLVDSLTKVLNRWNAFLNTATGQQRMARFFHDARELTERLFASLGRLVGVFGRLTGAMMPLLTHAFDILNATVVPVLEAFSKFIANTPGIREVASALIAVGLAVKTIKFVGAITGATELLQLLTRIRAASAVAGAASGAAAGAGGAAAGAAEGGLAARALQSGAVSALGRGLLRVAGPVAIGVSLVSGIVSGINSKQSSIGGKLQDVFHGLTLGLVPKAGLNMGQQLAKTFGDGMRQQGKEIFDKGDLAQLTAYRHQTEELQARFGNAPSEWRKEIERANRQVATMDERLAHSRIRQSMAELRNIRFPSLAAFTRQITSTFWQMPNDARLSAAKSMIDMARQMERDGRMPKGSTRDLINWIKRTHRELIPGLASSGRDSIRALNAALRDERVIRTVDRQVDQMRKTWGFMPRFAKTTSGNVREQWRAAMDFLLDKIRHSTGKQREVAMKQYTALMQQSDAVTASMRHSWNRTLDGMLARAQRVFPGIVSVFSGMVDALIPGLSHIASLLGAIGKQLGVTGSNWREFASRLSHPTLPADLRPPTPRRGQVGGPVGGLGAYGGGDRHSYILEDGEHILTKEEVRGMGGHGGVESFRNALRRSLGLGSVVAPTNSFRAVGGAAGVAAAPRARGAGNAGDLDARMFANYRRSSTKEMEELEKAAQQHARKTKKHVKDNAEESRDEGIKAFKDLRKGGGKEFKTLGNDVDDHMKLMRRNTRKTVGSIADDVLDGFRVARNRATTDARRTRSVVSDEFHSMSRAVDRHVTTVPKNVRRGFERANQFAARLSANIDDTVSRSFFNTDTAVQVGTDYIGAAVNKALSSLGTKSAAFSIPKPKALFTGGIPSPGGSAHDDHILMDPRGNPVAALSGTEGILNAPQMAEVHDALAFKAAFGGGRFGGLDDLWAAGMRHHAGGGRLREFAEGGSVSIGPEKNANRAATNSRWTRLVAAMNKVSSQNWPYHWGGGHEQPAHFEPFDCSGAVSYVVQQAGYNVPTTTSGGMGSLGFPGGPGPVTIYYNGGHTFMRAGNRYWGTSGFARPNGGAGWFTETPGPGYLNGFRAVHLPGINGIGPWGGSASLPTLSLNGPPGSLRDMAAQGLRNVRSGAQKYVDRKTAALADLSGQGLADMGSYDGPLDRVFPSHTLSNASGHVRLRPNQVRGLAGKAGLPADTFEKIAHGESDYYPGIISSDGGYGLWQMTPRVQSQQTISAWHRIGSYFNPWRNALMAKYLYKAAGNSISPWFGTQYLRLGGRLRKFAGGGPLGPRYTGGAPQTTSSGWMFPRAQTPPSATFGYQQGSATFNRSERSAVGKWSKGIAALETQASQLTTRYSNLSSRFDLSDESDMITESRSGKPHLNVTKWGRRVHELRELIKIQKRIRAVYVHEREYMDQLRNLYRDYRNRLRRAIRHARNRLERLSHRRGSNKKERGNIQAARESARKHLHTYQGRLHGVEGKLTDLRSSRFDMGQNIFSTTTDIMGLDQELRALDPGHRGDLIHDYIRDQGGGGDLGGDSGGGDLGAGSDDLQAQLDQARTRIQGLMDTITNQSQTLSVFRGSGDIGVGAMNAFSAALESMPVGTGSVRDSFSSEPFAGSAGGSALQNSGGFAGSSSALPAGTYLVKSIGDVAGQRELAAASNAGNAQSGYIPASIELTGL